MLFPAAQLMGVGLDREMAGALLSIFVLVALCISGDVTRDTLTRLLIPTNPALSTTLSLLSSSPMLCPLFLGSWLEASLGAEWNSAPLPILSLFLMDYFSGTSKSQLSFLQNTTGHCQRVSGLGLAPGEESEGKKAHMCPTPQGQDHANVCRKQL